MVAPAAGTNSLYPVPGASQAAQENVVTITLDSYADQSGVARFALVKIDAEGHDLAVLHGARALLAEHRITVAQFEYNHRWILARFFLRDAFEFLLALGYRVGKLTPRGVEFYPGWDRGPGNVRGRQLPGLRSGGGRRTAHGEMVEVGMRRGGSQMRIGVIGRVEPDMFGANILEAVRDAGHVAVPLGPARASHRPMITRRLADAFPAGSAAPGPAGAAADRARGGGRGV